jgi:hypothetical protein
LEGTLVGTRQGDSDWRFEGTGKLAAVKFAMTNVDLEEILAEAEDAAAASSPTPAEAPANARFSHEKLADRLAAAATISDPQLKDKSLTSLAKDAARASEIDIMNSTLSQMIEMGQRDEATHEAAVLLAKAGRSKQAIETAKGIADPDLRDKTLAELAQ